MSELRESLANDAERTILSYAGVDNWEWYGEALSSYVEDDDRDVDNANYLNALDAGGVDNWEWYGETRKLLNEYEEYLDEQDDLSEALPYREWCK